MPSLPLKICFIDRWHVLSLELRGGSVVDSVLTDSTKMTRQLYTFGILLGVGAIRCCLAIQIVQKWSRLLTISSPVCGDMGEPRVAWPYCSRHHLGYEPPPFPAFSEENMLLISSVEETTLHIYYSWFPPVLICEHREFCVLQKEIPSIDWFSFFCVFNP